MKNRNKKRIIFLLLLAFAISIIYVFVNRFTSTPDELTYDKVISYVKANEITKIQAEQNSLEISVTLKDGTDLTAMIPSLEEFSAFISEEIANGSEIEFVVKEENILLSSILSSGIKIILYVLIIFSIPKIMTSMTGKNPNIIPVKSKVMFDDVAGIDEEKAQLQEIVQFLKHPQKYIASGAKIPCGILLNGAPGTGKTLLAKAIAGEAGVPFFQVTGSSFEEKYVGVGASRIRDLFTKAKKMAPCIIFIDEIDSIAQNRYNGKSYNEQTLNQLLAEMDGFESQDNIIVIAATNHIGVLDAAITRPGRFDRHIFIPMPDAIAREKILQVHAKNKRFSDDISLTEIARKTVGFTGADLENILNEAAIYSVNNGHKVITKEAIDESIARVLIGLAKKNSAITEADRYLTAVHEAGHAITSAIVRPEIKNFGISIVPRGSAGGYNLFDEADKIYQSKSDLLKTIQVCYGGMVAEEIVFGEPSTGSSSDLEKATKIAYLMATKFAMNGSLLTKIPRENDFNAQLDSTKTDQLEKICKEAYDLVSTIILNHKEQLLELANLLMENEYLSQEDVETFFAEKL